MKNFNALYHILNRDILVPANPIATYVPYKISDKIIYISAQLPWQGKTIIKGKVGIDVTVNEAVMAARTCAQHILYHLKKK